METAPPTQDARGHEPEDEAPDAPSDSLFDNHVENSLRLSQERFDLVVGATEDGIWDWDIATGNSYVSPRWLELIGYRPQDIKVTCWRTLFEWHLHPEDRERVADELNRHLDARVPFRTDYRLQTRSGAYRWFHARGQAVWNAEGKPVRFAGAQRDITERREAEQRLIRMTQLYAALSQTNQTIIHVKERSALFPAICRIAVEHGHFSLACIGLFDASSGKLVRVAAHGPIEQMGGSMDSLSDGDSCVSCGATETALLTGEHQVVDDFDANVQSFDAPSRAAALGLRSMASFPLREDGKVVGVLNLYGAEPGMFDEQLLGLLAEMAQDISFALDNIRREEAHRAAQEALRRSDALFQQFAANVPDVFWIADPRDGRRVYVSPAYEQIWGRATASLYADGDWLTGVHPDDRARVRAALRSAAEFDEEYRVVRPDGAVRWVRDRGFPAIDRSGAVVSLTGIAQDITERKHYEDRVLQLAHFDSLTGLPNRELFQDRLRQALAHAERDSRIAAVLFVDLDQFKLVNDTLGHAAGDELLRQVSARLQRIVHTTDTVARLGGDEFGMILSDLESSDEALPLAQNVMGAFEAPFRLDGREIFVTASLGITLYPADSADPDMLIRYADVAMYRAKEVGRNSFQFYTTEMNARSSERLELGSHLRRALERGEFALHFQPKIELASGSVCGVEALLRWTHPELGAISPARFVPILEEIGLIGEIGEWVVDSACRQIRAWKKQGLAIPVSVNLSGRHLRQSGLDKRIRRMLTEHDVDPHLLELEITESVLMNNADQSASMLRSLKAIGVRLAVDDFGTGYSSLGYLKSFPLDTLKVDRTFVRDVAVNPDDALITGAIISMARSLGPKVVAEGVENQAQLTFLAAHGCQEMQGYFFSPALDAEACTRLLTGQGQSHANALVGCDAAAG